MFQTKIYTFLQNKKFLATVATDGNVFTAEAEGHDIWGP